MRYDNLTITREGGRAVVTRGRPDARNELNVELIASGPTSEAFTEQNIRRTYGSRTLKALGVS